MAVELKIPRSGESITEVQIGEWLKSEGDFVEKDENVVAVETDKASMDLPAPASGTLSRILKNNGEMANVGDVIAMIEESQRPADGTTADRRGDEKKHQKRAEKTGAAKAAEETRSARKPAPAQQEVSARPANARSSDDSGGRAQDPAATRQVSQAPPRQPFAMPAAQRALVENDLSIDDVTPTGPGGRVLKEDVERAARERRPEPGKASERPTAAVLEPGDGDRVEEAVPMSMLRRRIAQRLVESQQTAALLTTFNEIDMSAVMALRGQRGEAFEKKYGVRLGFMSFFVKAAIDALKLIPQVNAEVRGNDIIYKNYYDIGVAVSTERGLVVPVVRSAERLSFAEIELTINELAERGRAGKLALEELQGGTFTISNGGVFGSLMSTPIVNPPQSGILGLHAIQERPVAREGQVVIRPMMYVALTYDHRIVDGRESVTFLKRIKECVEDPARMLIEV